jgi:hypothetical protein
MKLFLILTLLSFNVWSSGPLTPVALSTFQVHIRPQLVNIHQDIQQILLTFPGYPQEILNAQQSVDQLMSQTLAGQSFCKAALNKQCLPQLEGAIQALRELERVWLAQEAHMQFPADSTIASLAGKKRWIKMLKSVQGLRVKLEIEIIAISAQRAGKRMGSWEWRKAVDEIEDWQDLMIVDYVPGKLQDDFRSAWMNFFRPLHKQCVLGNNRQYLASNLASLNFYWNLLNVKLTKRLKKTPEGMSGPLNAIQNRWNQVMRISFGQ